MFHGKGHGIYHGWCHHGPLIRYSMVEPMRHPVRPFGTSWETPWHHGIYHDLLRCIPWSSPRHGKPDGVHHVVYTIHNVTLTRTLTIGRATYGVYHGETMASTMNQSMGWTMTHAVVITAAYSMGSSMNYPWSMSWAIPWWESVGCSMIDYCIYYG